MDRPVGQGRADRDGRRSSATRTTSPADAGRCRRTSPTRSRPSSRPEPEGRDGLRGRLRPRRGRRPDERRSRRPTTTSSTSRRSAARRRRGRRRRHRRHVQGQRRPRRRSVEYLATPEAAEIWAASAAVLVAEQERRPDVYPDDLQRDDGDRRRPRLPVRPLRPASRRSSAATRCSRISRTSSRTRTSTRPRRSSRAGRGGGVQVSET